MVKIFSLLCLFVSLLALFPLGATTYTYAKETGKEHSLLVWQIEEDGQRVEILGKGPNGTTHIVASSNRETSSFTHSHTQVSEYTMCRKGGQLFVCRLSGGRRREAVFDIGTLPWIQEFDFSLRPFVLSQEASIQFCIVHPKKLTLHRMVATKGAVEKLDLGRATYHAQQVKITLTGIKKMFWHARLWFDLLSGDLLKYQANEGPNTPTSTLTLLSKEE